MRQSFSHIRYLMTAFRMGVNAFREGRLSASPSRWLLDLRHLHGVMRTGAQPAVPVLKARTRPPLSPASIRDAQAAARGAFEAFLRSGGILDFEVTAEPIVSVLLILHNRAELTFRCLESLAADRSIPLELVIFDNASSDGTGRLLDRVRGARVLRSPENVGFLRGCNQAAHASRGQYLLFLNNDTELHSGSLAASLDTLRRDSSIGAVGGRLVFPDGRLQEAGSIIWNDGSCLGYGRGDSPWKPEYSFQRDVDYCSAAFLLTPRRLFTELGGFDARYEPAYYEDADYCVRLWKSGMRVVYEPRAVVTHVEFGSGSAASATARQLERRSVFVQVHQTWLTHQASPMPGAIHRARARSQAAPQLVFIDDRVPHRRFGAGFPRSREILCTARELGYRVTFYPLAVPNEEWAEAYVDIPGDVELMLGCGVRGLRGFLNERLPHIDVLLVSRPHNMQAVASVLSGLRDGLKPPLLYDAEAIFAMREIGRRKLFGPAVTDAEARKLIAEELACAKSADVVLTVSELERRHFVDAGVARVDILGHSLTATPTPSPFASRDGFLFVGAMTSGSPNADAVRWLVTEILPLVGERLGYSPRLRVAGLHEPSAPTALAGTNVEFVGMVDDLSQLYDSARVFVAPTRFAAGVPLKVQEAAACGVPVICTSLLAHQLGWRDGVEVLVADTADEFAERSAALCRDADLWTRLREAALARVAKDCSPVTFRTALGGALAAARHGASHVGPRLSEQQDAVWS